MITNIEIRHLRYFVVVAEELHFGRAAQRVHIAQPALSQQIRNLEKQIKVRLFDRTTRSVALTAAGESFLAHARSVLHSIDDAVLSAQVASGQSISTLRVATTYTITFRFLKAILQEFHKQYPEVQIELDSLTTREITQKLESNGLHAGFVRPKGLLGELQTAKLFEETIVAALPKKHRLSKKKMLYLEDFANEPVIEFRDDEVSSAWFYSELQLARVPVKQVHVARNSLVVVALVAAGLGVGLVPDWVAYLNRDDIELRRIADLSRTIDLSVAWRRHDPSPELESFIEITKMVSKEWREDVQRMPV